MPLVTRRRLIVTGALTVGAAAVAALPLARRVRSPADSDLVALLDRLLSHHIALAPDAIPRFVAEYVKRYGAKAAGRYASLTVGGLATVGAVKRLLPAGRQADIDEFERRLVSTFLRSTDHFRIAPGAAAQFVAFASPYEVGCANPLANLSIVDC